jgi:broad specificity phosphatase PhoE
MTNWWWIRHGPTHIHDLIGWTDVAADLSDVDGLARLHDHLPDDAVVISSDLIRCVATADAIQGKRERLPHSDELREFHFGDWEMRNYREINEKHPELSREFWENPGDVAPPNGESWNVGAARINAAVDRITTAYEGRHIVAVAHFGAILTQVQRATNMSASSALSFKIDNLSLTEIEHMGGEDWRVLGVNHNL